MLIEPDTALDTVLVRRDLGAVAINVRWAAEPESLGKPIQGATVSLLATDTMPQRVTDSRGVAFFQLAPGTYQLRVRLIGGDPVSANVTVRRGIHIRVSVRVQGHLTFCDDYFGSHTAPNQRLQRAGVWGSRVVWLVS